MATAWHRFIDLIGFNWSFKPNISQLFPEHCQMVGRLKQLVSNTAVTQQYGIHLPKQEMQVRPLVWEDSLEMEIATHSSILAWEISWTERSLAGYRS